MVELQSKIDPEYKKPLQSWENERWENLEEVRWKGQRSFQQRRQQRQRQTQQQQRSSSGMGDNDEAVQLIMTTNSNTSLSDGTDVSNDGGNGNVIGIGNVGTGSVTTATTASRHRRPSQNRSNSTSIISNHPSMPTIVAGRLRGYDGNVCECSCCVQGASHSFIDREHGMRYLFGEGG